MNGPDKLKVRAAHSIARQIMPAQMPLWPDNQRAIANELTRAPLFTCRKHGEPRQHYSNHSLFVLGEGQVTFTGEELRTFDEDIFITLAHAAREFNSDKLIVNISSKDICKLNDLRPSQQYYTEIYKSVQRMRGAVITVFSKRLAKVMRCEQALQDGASDEVMARLYSELDSDTEGSGIAGYMFSLISGEPKFQSVKDQTIDNVPQGDLRWEIQLDKRLVSLFAKPYLTLIDFSARKRLSPVAKRLQGYYSSHKQPFDVKIKSLSGLLNLKNSTGFKERQTLNRALNELKENGIISDFQVFKNDKGEWLVAVTR